MVDRGFLAVLAGRLLPMMPFVVLSYGAGLTAIRPAPYALATAIGIVPSTILQVGIGASAGVLIPWASTVTMASLLLVVLVPAGVGIRVWRRRSGAPAAAEGPAALS
jgi:uncharacterized membrane protein YdjX (TVP38/TMEM64 family)